MSLIAGMGTEVEPKMYLPGYYALKDLDDNVSNGSWTVHHESRTSKHGQYYDIFLTRPAIDGYLGNDKEQLRQTILKHESIFKHQLNELHRLYKRQRDLMNEIKLQELRQHPTPGGTSLSSFFSSRISSEDAKYMWHIPKFPSVDSTCGRPSMCGTDSIRSPLSFIKEKIMQSGHVPTQNGVQLKDHNSFKSKCKKLQRRLFNLELPADKYIDNEEEQVEERVSGVLGVEGYPRNEGRHKRDANLSLSSCMNSGGNGDATPSNLYSSNHGLADLNEPIQVEEESTSASVDTLGNITCSKEERRRWDLFVNSNSGFQCLEKCGRSKDSFHGGFQPKDSPMPFKSLPVEPRKGHEPSTLLPSDQGKTELQRKRTTVGVEFSERNHDLSVVASHTPALNPRVPQYFEPPFVSSWSKLPNNWGQNLLSVQEHTYFNDSAPSNKSSKTTIQSPGSVGEILHVNSNSSYSPRFSVEVSYQNGLCLGSQTDSKELRVPHPSSSTDYLIGITANNSTSEQFVQHGPLKYCKVSDHTDVKSAKNVKMDVVPPDKFQNEDISQQNHMSVKEQRKHEKPQGQWPWLMKPLCDDESFKGKDGSYKMKLDSWQNYSHLFSGKTEIGRSVSQCFVQDSFSEPRGHDAEHKKIKVGDSLSIRKILGVPIIDKPHSSKDLFSFSSPSKPSCFASSVFNDNSGKVGLLNSDLPCDASSLEAGEQLKVEGLVVEKGLDNCSAGFRHQIDLNLCLFEEEVPSRPSSPTTIVKIAAEKNLEAPIVLEPENGISPEGESPEIQLKKPSESLQDESGELHERLIRVAAEAIVAISSSSTYNLSNDATCYPSEAPQSDSLHWFAEVISSYKLDLENEVRAVSMRKDAASHEEFIGDVIDYFEFMTLKLPETKVEEYYCKPQALEKQEDEETLPKRPRRGQAKRGRQRKDFQRDILPGLASLSRHEVTEDLQEIEVLIRACGGTWQSSLSKRNATKNGSGRGRRRCSGGSSTPAPTVKAVSPPPIQQANYRELGLEEKSLTGWGKRTRRPPRQRCLIGNLPLLSK